MSLKDILLRNNDEFSGLSNAEVVAVFAQTVVTYDNTKKNVSHIQELFDPDLVTFGQVWQTFEEVAAGNPVLRPYMGMLQDSNGGISFANLTLRSVITNILAPYGNWSNDTLQKILSLGATSQYRWQEELLESLPTESEIEAARIQITIEQNAVNWFNTVMNGLGDNTIHSWQDALDLLP